MDLKNGVMNIQAVGYNGVRAVIVNSNLGYLHKV